MQNLLKVEMKDEKSKKSKGKMKSLTLNKVTVHIKLKHSSYYRWKTLNILTLKIRKFKAQILTGRLGSPDFESRSDPLLDFIHKSYSLKNWEGINIRLTQAGKWALKMKIWENNENRIEMKIWDKCENKHKHYK